MRIGVNLLQYTDTQGIEVFAANLLEELLKLAPEQEFVFFVNQISASMFNEPAPNMRQILVRFKKISRWRLALYQQTGFIGRLYQEKIDLLYCPSMAVPLFYRHKIVTVHDCASWRFKEESSCLSRLYLALVSWSAKYFSDKIVTVSEFSRQEIATLWHIAANRIALLSEGVPRLSDPGDIFDQSWSERWPFITQPYFFYIGNLRPRKNLARLLEAWSDFSVEHPNHFLVIAGKGQALATESKRVIFLGSVSEEEKVVLYKKSVALVFPSLYEGFGLPILEAQKLGVPVISANRSALPDVAGAGAILVDPEDVAALTGSLEKIIKPDFPRAELIAAGYQNLSRFSWIAAARSLKAAMMEADKNNRPHRP